MPMCQTSCTHFESLEERIVHMTKVTGWIHYLNGSLHPTYMLTITVVIVDKDFQKISVHRPGDYASGAQTLDKDTLTPQFHKLLSQTIVLYYRSCIAH